MLTRQLSASDRRIETRIPAAGEVRLSHAGTPEAPFVGHLLDVAASGFRARHDRCSLGSGQLVDFQFGERHGLARTVWTRIVDGRAETGFRICLEDRGPPAV